MTNIFYKLILASFFPQDYEKARSMLDDENLKGHTP